MKIKSIPEVKSAVYGADVKFALPLTVSVDKFREKACVLTEKLFYGNAEIKDEGDIKATFDESLKVKGEYKIKIAEGKAFISYGDYEGLRNALAEISNLLKIKDEKAYLPECDFNDKPKFPYRGILIDLARGMTDEERLMQDLILMAKAKINILHIHLSDDNGFALKLSCLKEEMFIENAYEVSRMKELIALCEALGLDIIPEFDCPGHSRKLIEVYPELACEIESGELFYWASCAGEEKTLALYEKIIDEICSIFPYEYFHIGGDELEMGDIKGITCHWNECRKCRALMKKENIADRQDLYYYIMTKIYELVKKNGKKVIMWNDQIDTEREVRLPSDMILQFWRVAAPKRGPYVNVSMNSLLKLGRKVINSHYPETYVEIDYSRERTVKDSNIENWKIDERPECDDEVKSNIMGSEMCVWGYGISDEYGHLVYTLPPEILIYGDKMWNNEYLALDEEYEKALTRILIGFECPDELNVFACLGGALLPRTNEKCIPSAIKKDKKYLTDTFATLSKMDGYFTRVYKECIKEAIEKI